MSLIASDVIYGGGDGSISCNLDLINDFSKVDTNDIAMSSIFRGYRLHDIYNNDITVNQDLMTENYT
jgi:hypothetical protein